MNYKKLLLHVCCAPCAVAVLDELNSEYEVFVVFINPNIQPEDEYQQRLAELKKLQQYCSFEIIDYDYFPESWNNRIKGLENEPEQGNRCTECFDLRLTEAALTAKAHNISIFATTLTLSPLKNYQLINKIGLNIAKKQGIDYLESNFKKNDGYKKSIKLSRKYGLYRQNYCGCLYSKKTVKIPEIKQKIGLN